MTNKEKIREQYFKKHKTQSAIAKELGISQSYISKIVNQDVRNEQERNFRTMKSKENKKAYNRNYHKNYKRPKKDDNSYEQLLALQKQDALELSYGYNDISDYAFAKWNSSAYHTNSKGNLILDRKLNVGNDVPKSIKLNIKAPTQKYKKKYCYSH